CWLLMLTFGRMLTIGVYVKSSAAVLAEEPPGVVTVTSATPALPAGAVMVICVSLLTVNPFAAAPPKVTPVAPIKWVPVIVTSVPPAVGPIVGVMFVTVGAASGET